MHEVLISLPRSAFSPREAARAGDVWRLFQDVAVEGSIRAGWPPERYRAEGVSFIVRSMVVRHHREAVYGERLTGRTWPSRFRRGMFFRRECRVRSERGPVASATQEWVHVTAGLELARASDALVDAFAVESHDPPIELPAPEPVDAGRAHAFELECWHTWMDPLAHANHPAYVDWCDEALSRAMVAEGLDPVRLAPVAERAFFRSGVVATERARVSTRLVGRCRAQGAAAFEHRVEVGDRLCAKVTSLRRLHGEGEGDESALLALG
ncbi:MAG TPA: thioesterase [Sandaracinaceae bacterium LLY-WYZ-13_1]|nr:thioesterase [Sandaracinaceae bacterium LLY-WYZ-13_1]